MPRKKRAANNKRIGTPAPSSEAALKRMQAARPRDTAPEKALRSSLHNRGLRFRVDQKIIQELNRKADIVFRSAKVAVFVDGCFWHGCPIHGTHAKANAEFWKNKIERNQARDLDTNNRLNKAGWRIVRVWEHEDPEKVSKKIYSLVKRRNARYD
jgi:DNA mismatch endonuclease (patch repair protein)